MERSIFFLFLYRFLAKCKADVHADAAFNVFCFFFKYRIYIPYLVVFTNVYKMYSLEATIFEAFPIIAKNVGNKS